MADWFERARDGITLGVILGGLWLGWDQATKLRESIDVANRNNSLSTWNSVAEQWLNIDRAFLDNPGLRRFIYGGAAAAEDAEQQAQAEAMANLVLDFIDYASSTAAYMIARNARTDEIIQPEAWESSFAEIFRGSPLVCRLIQASPDSYGAAARALARRSCPPPS